MLDPQMESRTCQCGCGQSFRVLTTSPQRYSSEFCRETHRRPASWMQLSKGLYSRERVRTIFLRVAEAMEGVEINGPLTMSQLSDVLKVSTGTLKAWAHAGRIPYQRLKSGTWQFDFNQVREALALDRQHLAEKMAEDRRRDRARRIYG